jgi:hypothetical protein
LHIQSEATFPHFIPNIDTPWTLIEKDKKKKLNKILICTFGLYIVVSTPNMTKRDISEMKTKPWLNPPTIDDKVSMIDYCISLSLN